MMINGVKQMPCPELRMSIVHVMKAVLNQGIFSAMLRHHFEKFTSCNINAAAADAEQMFKENDWMLVQYDKRSMNCRSSYQK